MQRIPIFIGINCNSSDIEFNCCTKNTYCNFTSVSNKEFINFHGLDICGNFVKDFHEAKELGMKKQKTFQPGKAINPQMQAIPRQWLTNQPSDQGLLIFYELSA